jgi:hypothetical protein
LKFLLPNIREIGCDCEVNPIHPKRRSPKILIPSQPKTQLLRSFSPMKKKAIPFYAILGCLALVASVLAAEPKKKQNTSKMEKIAQIDSASVSYIKTNPPQLKIEAHGQAATPNWSHPTLVPRVYIQPPPDGIWDYDFVATPPPGITTQVLTPISAELVLTEIPKGMKGVRIHSKSNSKVAKLEGPK